MWMSVVRALPAAPTDTAPTPKAPSAAPVPLATGLQRGGLGPVQTLTSAWRETSVSPMASASTRMAPSSALVHPDTGLDPVELLALMWMSAARKIFAKVASVPTLKALSSASVPLDTVPVLTSPPARTWTNVASRARPCVGHSAVRIHQAPIAVSVIVILDTTRAQRAPVMMWTSAKSMVHLFVELSAARTPLVPTAVCRLVSPAISLRLAGDARMWTNAGTDPSAGPMLCARTCQAPSSASVTRATRGRGTGATAWM